MAKINKDKLLEQLKAGKQEFTEIDFSGISLNRVDFYGCKFEDCSFRNAYLEQCDFVGSNLVNPDFTNATLTDVVFEWSTLVNAIFRKTILIGVQIRNSNLADSDWQNANLKESKLEHSNFYNANFYGAVLNKVLLNNNDILRVNFNTVNLTEIKHKGANLVLTNSLSCPDDLKIVEKIKEDSDIQWLVSGDANKVNYFLWIIPNWQQITILDILKWGQYPEDTLYEEDDFINHYNYNYLVDRDSEFRNFKPVEENLTDIMVYIIGTHRGIINSSTDCFDLYRVYESADIYLIGKTPSGNFAGCTTEIFWG